MLDFKASGVDRWFAALKYDRSTVFWGGHIGTAPTVSMTSAQLFEFISNSGYIIYSLFSVITVTSGRAPMRAKKPTLPIPSFI